MEHETYIMFQKFPKKRNKNKNGKLSSKKINLCVPETKVVIWYLH